MSPTDDVTPPGPEPEPEPEPEPRTMRLGPVEVDADYTGLERLRARFPEEAYINQMYAQISQDKKTRIWPQIATSRSDARTWLAQALYLYMRNRTALPRSFDVQAAVSRLTTRAARHTAMPTTDGRAFEREVLGVSGWTGAAVPRALTGPRRDVLSRLQLIYRPSAADSDGTGGPNAVLRPDVLHELLLPRLKQEMAEQARHWRPPPGGQLEAEPIDRIRDLADFVQRYVVAHFRPYADGWQDGPCYSGFRYSECLQSTWVLPADVQSQHNYLFSRAQAVGWDAEYGRPLAAACYDSSRPQDQQALRGIISGSLQAGSQLQNDVVLLIKHTASQCGDAGKIFVQTVFPRSSWGTRTDWRSRMIRTLAHELLHRLAHPGFTATATEKTLIRNSQIINEGFVDLLAADIFTELWHEVERDEKAAALLLGGIESPGSPAGSFFKVGYGDAGTSASEIRRLVGNDRVRAAFFLGATDLIGLDRSA